MTRATALSVAVVAALVSAAAAPAKEFSTLALVGRGGDTRELRLPPRVIDGLFSGRTPARAEGGYVRVYPLDAGGHVGVPGRFYPETAAICLSWNQAATRRDCRRAPNELAAALSAARRLRRFRDAGTTLAELSGPNVPRGVATQLRVAVELAFDRPRLARKSPAPPRCVRFVARWRGGGAAARPRDFCLSLRGVHHGGVLHPLGTSPGQLAWSNRCDGCGGVRRVHRSGVSALYPLTWHVLTVDRPVVNPKLRFQLSTGPGEDGASVSPRGAVVRVEELLPPLRTRATARSFPPRPQRFELGTFDRMGSWPRGRGTRFRERGRTFYVWIALGAAAGDATRERVLGVLESVRVTTR